MPKHLPYYFALPGNPIQCIGLTPDSELTPEQASRLQMVDPRAVIGPNLDRLPPRRREPIRDIELTPAPPYVEVGGEQCVTPSTVSERRAGPDCSPANGASQLCETALESEPGSKDQHGTPLRSLRDWAMTRSWHRLQGIVRKVVG